MLNWFRSIMNSGSVLGYFFQAVPITCFVGIVYLIIRVVTVKRNKLKVELLKEIMKLLSTCYLTGLISLVVLPANFWLSFFDGILLGWWDEMLPIFSFGGFNLVPSLIKALSGELTIGSWVKTMLIGNIAMFLPLGFFLPFVTERVNRKNIFVVAIADIDGLREICAGINLRNIICTNTDWYQLASYITRILFLELCGDLFQL